MIYLLFFVGLETVLITKLQKFRISALLCFCSFRGICMNFFLSIAKSKWKVSGLVITLFTISLTFCFLQVTHDKRSVLDLV